MLLAEALTEQVIGLAIEVHRHTGPGLLETMYEQCLCLELRRVEMSFARQVAIPVLYKGERVGDGFKADIVVAQTLILEIKSVGAILPVVWFLFLLSSRPGPPAILRHRVGYAIYFARRKRGGPRSSRRVGLGMPALKLKFNNRPMRMPLRRKYVRSGISCAADWQSPS